MRIAIIVGSFPVVSETFIMRQITGLLELGHSVDVFSDNRPEAGSQAHPEVEQFRLLERTVYMDLPPEMAPWEMPVWPITGETWVPGDETALPNWKRAAKAAPRLLKCLATAPKLTFQVLKASEYGYQAASFSALYRLEKLLSKKGQYDVVHAHFGPNGNSFRFVRGLWRVPLVVSFHGYDFTTLPRQEGLGMYEKLFKTADVFTVNSEYTRGCVQKLGCPPDKIKFLPVGLDPCAFPFHERTLTAGQPVRILSVGRLVEVKGHEFLIQAVAQLSRKHPAVLCEIIGDGPSRPQLQALIDGLGLKNVQLLGSCVGSVVRTKMAEAHILVMGSVSVEGDQEGQGLVLQEAQACGLPVIATRHGALPEGLLEGQSGFLVPEKDIAAMAGRLEYLVEHPELWPEFGQKGRAFVVGRYDIRKLNHQLAAIYSGAIKQFKN